MKLGYVWMAAAFASSSVQALAQAAEIRWRSEATVHDGDRKIDIQTRTRLGPTVVVSESWPTAMGEAKGLRRMIIEPGEGWIERGGTRTAMAADMLAEERQQFGFYTALEQAVAWCDSARDGIDTFGVTAFRCTAGRVGRAANWIGPIRQDFRIDGLLRSNGRVFPRNLSIRRDGKPYFDMKVTRFEATGRD